MNAIPNSSIGGSVMSELCAVPGDQHGPVADPVESVLDQLVDCAVDLCHAEEVGDAHEQDEDSDRKPGQDVIERHVREPQSDGGCGGE
nr:hypothetical protein [Blastococcus sp. Marseille-P5729]